MKPKPSELIPAAAYAALRNRAEFVAATDADAKRMLDRALLGGVLDCLDQFEERLRKLEEKK